MKKLLVNSSFVLLTALVAIAEADGGFISPFVTNNEKEGVVIMSFNIKRGRDSSSASIKKLVNSYKEANPNRTVVIGLQEVVYDSQAKYLSQGYRKISKKTLSNYGILLLSNEAFQQSRSLFIQQCDAKEPRGITAGKINGVWYLNTHLTYLKGSIGCQLTSLAHIVNSLGDKVVVIGDLNTTDNTEVFKNFINDTGLSVSNSAYTFPAKSPNRRIDYILSKGVSLGGIDVVPTKISDHLAIISTVQ